MQEMPSLKDSLRKQVNARLFLKLIINMLHDNKYQAPYISPAIAKALFDKIKLASRGAH